jgi:outer membrane protein
MFLKYSSPETDTATTTAYPLHKNPLMNIRTWLFGLAFLAGTGTLRAQYTDTSSYSFSLSQAVAFALENNSTLKNVTLDQQAATYKVKEVVGAGLPQINASAQVQNFLELPTQLIPGEFFGGPPGTFIPVQFGTKYNATAGFTASQLLFNGSYFVGIKAANTYQELARKNVDRTRLETVTDVTKAYYTALVNEERKKLIAANLARVEKLLHDTRLLVENDFVEQIDLDRITVTYNNLTTEANNVQRLLDLSVVLLKYQMGMDQGAKLTLTDKLDNISFTPPEPFAGRFDYRRRVEYELGDLALVGSRLQLKAERMGYLPTVFLFGSANAQAQRQELDIFNTNKPWYPIVVIGLQVDVPIFDGLQRHYRVQQAKIGVLKAENNLIMIQRSIDMQQTIARVTLQNSAATLQAQQANMELAQKVYDVAKIKFEQGNQSSLEIMNAETGLKEAQTNYFNALYDAIIAKVEYEKSLGLFAK